MSWATEPLEIFSENILVRSLRASDFESIAAAIHDPTGWSGRKWGIDTPDKIREMLNLQLESQAKGECSPFVYFVGNEVAGISRFLHLAPHRKALEIGGTCVAPKWRRTFVNTEVKQLLLTHAFEKLEAVRIELRVDCLNYPSQMNVLRLGAVFEGKIRHWQVRKDGQVPDGLLYSITNKEWPSVKVRLDLLRSGQPPKPTSLPLELNTPRLRIRLNKLLDAQSLLELAQRNSKSLIESFPQLGAFKTTEEAHSYIAERAHWASADSAFYYGVWDKDTNRLMGQLLVKNINWKVRSAELGYLLGSEYRGKGIAVEMANAVLDELFNHQQFRRVSLRVIPTNEPSIRLAKKLGFKQEGILHSEFMTGTGECVDNLLFSKVREVGSTLSE